MDRVVARLDGFIESLSNSSIPLLHGSGQGLFAYADTNPVTTFSLEGILFLATNIPFVVAAQILRSSGSAGEGDLTLATLAPALDLSAVLSFLYHYAQLHFGPNRSEVKRFLLFDYVSAFFTCCIVTLEVFPFILNFSEHHQASLRVEPLLCGLLSVGALLQSWRFDKGRQYLLYHGLWHVGSAYTCFLLK